MSIPHTLIPTQEPTATVSPLPVHTWGCPLHVEVAPPGILRVQVGLYGPGVDFYIEPTHAAVRQAMQALDEGIDALAAFALTLPEPETPATGGCE